MKKYIEFTEKMIPNKNVNYYVVVDTPKNKWGVRTNNAEFKLFKKGFKLVNCYDYGSYETRYYEHKNNKNNIEKGEQNV